MIRPSPRLEEFERWYAREHVEKLTYEDALEIFAALWQHARAVNPDFPGDWREDVQVDIEVARVLNALPDEG